MYFGYIVNLKDLLAIFRRNYGWNHCTPYMLHKLAIVAFYKLENLTNAESCASFLGSIESIRQMAGSWFVAKPILLMIELYTERIDMPVPTEAWQIFASNHDEPWVHDGVSRVLKMYPSGAFRSEIYGGRLDDLLTDLEGEGYEYDEEDEGDYESGIVDMEVNVSHLSPPSYFESCDSLLGRVTQPMITLFKQTPARQRDPDPVTPSQSAFPDTVMGASRNPILANLLNSESESCFQPPSITIGASSINPNGAERSLSYSHPLSWISDGRLRNSW